MAPVLEAMVVGGDPWATRICFTGGFWIFFSRNCCRPRMPGPAGTWNRRRPRAPTSVRCCPWAAADSFRARDDDCFIVPWIPWTGVSGRPCLGADLGLGWRGVDGADSSERDRLFSVLVSAWFLGSSPCPCGGWYVYDRVLGPVPGDWDPRSGWGGSGVCLHATSSHP